MCSSYFGCWEEFAWQGSFRKFVKMGLHKACVLLLNSGLLQCLGQVLFPASTGNTGNICAQQRKAQYFIFFHVSEFKNKHFEVKDL